MLSAIRLPISALFIVLWPHPSHQAAASELSGKTYREAPMLTARVQRGELPPILAQLLRHSHDRVLTGGRTNHDDV